MKKIFFLLALCLGVIGTNAQNKQQDTFRREQLYNAYSVARQMVKMERQLRQLNIATESGDAVGYKDSIRTILGALVWYANLQDQDDRSQLDTLRNLLKGYKRLEALYTNLALKLYSLEFLEKESWAEAKANINSQFADTVHFNDAILLLENKTRNYFTLKNKLKTAQDTFKAREIAYNTFFQGFNHPGRLY